VIDLEDEKLITLRAAGQMLPPGRLGKPRSEGCVRRWIVTGVKLPSGERLRLEAVRIGGRWLTSVEALQRFAARQTPEALDEPAPLPRSVDERQRASEAAAKALEAMGV
jgi:hypothetical protein